MRKPRGKCVLKFGRTQHERAGRAVRRYSRAGKESERNDQRDTGADQCARAIQCGRLGRSEWTKYAHRFRAPEKDVPYAVGLWTRTLNSQPSTLNSQLPSNYTIRRQIHPAFRRP